MQLNGLLRSITGNRDTNSNRFVYAIAKMRKEEVETCEHKIH